MTVGECSAKFDELLKYWPYFREGEDDPAICSQYLNRLRAEIRQAVGYLQITDLSTLVSKCRSYEDDSRAKQNQWKSGGPQRSPRRHFRGAKKPYNKPNYTSGASYTTKNFSAGNALSTKPLNSTFVPRCSTRGGQH